MNKQLKELLYLAYTVDYGIHDYPTKPIKHDTKEAMYNLIRAIYDLYQTNYIINKEDVENATYVSVMESDEGVVARADFHLTAKMEDRFAYDTEKKYIPEIKDMLTENVKEKILYIFESNTIGDYAKK